MAFMLLILSGGISVMHCAHSSFIIIFHSLLSIFYFRFMTYSTFSSFYYAPTYQSKFLVNLLGNVPFFKSESEYDILLTRGGKAWNMNGSERTTVLGSQPHRLIMQQFTTTQTYIFSQEMWYKAWQRPCKKWVGWMDEWSKLRTFTVWKKVKVEMLVKS